jgi:hypothetical protein
LQVSVHLSILNASQYSEGPQIMAKRSWSTPEALSTSFLVDSCIIADWDVLWLLRRMIVFKKVAHGGQMTSAG